jgi:hypothetical protein
MKAMDVILELLKYVVPAGMVLATVAVILRDHRIKAETKQRYTVFQGALSQIIPLRLQAHERALLYLERISLEHLILRLDARNKSARAFQVEMISEVRAEFDHNLAQQLYIDNDSWDAVVRAKDWTIGFINHTAGTMAKDAAAPDLGKSLLKEMLRTEAVPTREAISILKRDVQKMFRFGANHG